MSVNSSTAIAVRPETLLVDLPAKPDWFDKELAQVAQKNGQPVFKVVDGQRELKWRNGKYDVKHLLQHDEVPAYVPVIRQIFRRMDTATWKPKYYTSYEKAMADPQVSLEPEVTWTNIVSTRAVGRACWIVEVLITAEETGYEAWESMRYGELSVKGIYQKVDMLGPFPRDGWYTYCFSVLGDEGEAIAPHRGIIEECKKRWRQMSEPSKSLEQELADYDYRQKKFEAKETARIADSFYQFHGVAARRIHEGAVSKPISKVYE